MDTSPTKRTALTFSNIKPHTEPPEESEEHKLSETEGKAKEAVWISWKSIQEWWSDITPFERDVLLASTCLKLLLFPA